MAWSARATNLSHGAKGCCDDGLWTAQHKTGHRPAQGFWHLTLAFRPVVIVECVCLCGGKRNGTAVGSGCRLLLYLLFLMPGLRMRFCSFKRDGLRRKAMLLYALWVGKLVSALVLLLFYNGKQKAVCVSALGGLLRVERILRKCPVIVSPWLHGEFIMAC